jgi:hypothetical protein
MEAAGVGQGYQVGVAGRIKQYTLDSDSRIAFYLRQTQFPVREMNVVLRSSADPQAPMEQRVERLKECCRFLRTAPAPRHRTCRIVRIRR